LAGDLDSLPLKTFTEPYRLQFHLSFQLENIHAQTDFCLALATASLPSLGHTLVTLNMTQVTCTNYLAMLPDGTRMFSAWMSGCFNQKFGYVWVDLIDFARNVAASSMLCQEGRRKLL
jgi:hypothetical protein